MSSGTEKISRLALVVRRVNRSWGPGETEVVDIFVDGNNLIDMAREVELPSASAEGHPSIAGRYQGLPPGVVFWPSRYFLGEQTIGGDTYRGKISIVSCAGCGDVFCWPLRARIELHESVVVWKNFEQPYRTSRRRALYGVSVWKHDKLGPFIFDKEQYLVELMKWPHSELPDC
jgi:hypothetical protein